MSILIGIRNNMLTKIPLSESVKLVIQQLVQNHFQ